MKESPLTISPETARRLAVRVQRLDRIPAEPNKKNILAIIRQLGCLQIDPINVVARSPLLVLFSRLNGYELAAFESLLWDQRQLFEYWAHAASIVLAEDYPIHQVQMINFRRGDGVWGRRVRQWMKINEPFRQYILEQIHLRGPLYAQELEDRAEKSWTSSGWSNTTNTTRSSTNTMLGFMWEQGDITVTRRVGKGFGLKKQWGLLEHHMPQWQEHPPLTQEEVVSRATEKSLRALGVATEKQINNHFIRGGYPGLKGVLVEMLDKGLIKQVAIRENGAVWPGEWFIHTDTLPELERLQNGDRPTRTTLLSPFDNLIADRERTELLFDFYYRSEIYTPKKKRKFGYYVMPILQGGDLIGRIDPQMDRRSKTLHINAVHAEDGAPDSLETGRAIAEAVDQLAGFLAADQVQYSKNRPPFWAKAFS